MKTPWRSYGSCRWKNSARCAWTRTLPLSSSPADIWSPARDALCPSRSAPSAVVP
uniref:Uncharacterized protein n=1 Tax=Anguilla anguilla TaxID=7936 RepID=A0A0E9WVJ7_ANGAN